MHKNDIAVTIESDADAAERLSGKIEVLAMQAGNGLKREPALGQVAMDAGAPAEVNPMIQAAAEVVVAAHSAADAATSVASKAADAATAASNAAAHAGSKPAGEAMSIANRAAEQNAYAANKAADSAANIADKAGEQARDAEVAASLLRHIPE